MGKSRYEPLVKLKKKSLDEAERALIAANNEVAGASDRLNTAYQALASLHLPQSGSIRELSQANMMIQTQHDTIDRCKEMLERAEEKQQTMRERFHASRIDFEKFSYLEVQEVNARIKKIKAQEAKMLDEIGTITYKRDME